MGINFFHFWPVLYPIMCSFSHLYNPNINFENYYFTTLTYGLGISYGGKISPFFYKLFGCQVGFYLCAGLHLIFLLLHMNLTSFWGIMFSYLFAGAQFSMVNSGCNLLISEKYTEGILYTKYFITSRLIVNFIWSFLLQLFTNPTAVPPLIKDE